jgi:hypothetical protein
MTAISPRSSPMVRLPDQRAAGRAETSRNPIVARRLVRLPDQAAVERVDTAGFGGFVRPLVRLADRGVDK